MHRLLVRACHQVSERNQKMLTETEYKAVQKRYRTILTQRERDLPPIPPRHNGQRGRVAKSDAHNLWERMKKYENAVLRFATNPDVAFTNNRTERDLRMSKVMQKVSGCFRTRKYAEAYCRNFSYLQSMANHCYSPLVAIQIALAGRTGQDMGEQLDSNTCLFQLRLVHKYWPSMMVIASCIAAFKAAPACVSSFRSGKTGIGDSLKCLLKRSAWKLYDSTVSCGVKGLMYV